MVNFNEILYISSAWDYFWYYLPYAIPAFITFIVGIFLTLIGLFAAFQYRDRKSYFLSFSLTMLGFGTLGFIVGLRAVILDRSILLFWNNWLYPLVMLFSPAAYFLLHQSMNRQYRILKYATILTTLALLLGVVGVVQNKAFLNQWNHYIFGNYPIASDYLKPWAVLSALMYFFILFPLFFIFMKKNRKKFFQEKYVLIGTHILIFLVATNFPSFMGYNLYPMANFSFIGMAIVAYGVFRQNFLNLHELFFERNFLYYIINSLIGTVFLVSALLAAIYTNDLNLLSM